MKDDLKICSVLMCDDIRKEITGKDILVGVYPTEFKVLALPVRIRTMFWIEITTHQTGPLNLFVKIESPSTKLCPEGQFRLTPGESGKIGFSVITPPMFIEIEKEGFVKFMVKSRPEEKYRCTKAYSVKYTEQNNAETIAMQSVPSDGA